MVILLVNYTVGLRNLNFFPVSNKVVVHIRIHPVIPPVSHFEHTLYFLAYVWPLCANMISSTKPEIHNALHCHQRRTKSNVHKNLTKFSQVVFEIGEWTDTEIQVSK